MHQLVPCLRDDHIFPDAVVGAHAAIERVTKLQQAFIAQLATDMRRRDERAWDETSFTHDYLEYVPGFYLGLADTMCEAIHDTQFCPSRDFFFKAQNGAD
jgi:hypothetical protein